VIGIPDPLDVEERLANLVADRIAPIVVPDVEVLPWRSKSVVAVQIYPSPVRPHYLRTGGLEGGVYVRLGSTNRRADSATVEELRRFSRNEAFDEQAIPDLNPEAIDFRAASESFAGVRKLRKADLRTLRLTVDYQGHEVPTVGGVLLFGSDREERFPDAWVQAGRFEGSDRSRLIDQGEIREHLPLAVERVVQFVQRNVARSAEIGEVRRTDRWQYPPVSVREAVVNAVTHADYSQSGAPIRISIFDDRLEVENPGLLPFGLTIEDVQRGVSKLRNRVIGRVFRELGLIEQWGSGVQRMTEGCVQAGLAPPLLEEIGPHFRVTMFAERGAEPVVDEGDERILRALRGGTSLGTKEIAKGIQRSERATRARLASLVGRGVVVEIGSGPFDPRRRYSLAETWKDDRV
jgi:ATP-dependent DNA helicase RecG